MTDVVITLADIWKLPSPVEALVAARRPISDCTIVDISGRTAYMHAAYYGWCDLFTKSPLAAEMVRYDNYGLTVLHLAARNNHAHVIQLILQGDLCRNAHFINRKDQVYGNTAMHYAAWSRSWDALEVLLKYGDPKVTNWEGTDLLSFVIYADAQDRRAAAIRSALLKLVRLQEDNSRFTAVHVAAQLGRCEAFEELVRTYGREVLRARAFTFTPLQLALRKRQYEIAELAIRLGADVNEPWGSHAARTALDFAITNRDARMVQILLTQASIVAEHQLKQIVTFCEPAIIEAARQQHWRRSGRRAFGQPTTQRSADAVSRCRDFPKTP